MDKRKNVYLDHAATSAPVSLIYENMNSFLDMFYNPSSSNHISKYNMAVIDGVRKEIARKINADPSEIIFTSGGSEANSMAMCCINNNAIVNDRINTVVASPICHSSITMDSSCEFLSCDKNGMIDLNDYKFNYDYTLYCIDFVNNEIGTIQNIKKISNKIHKKDGNVLFVDAVQAFGKIDIDVKKMGIDAMSASAHKIGGIVGCGFLYVSKDLNIIPMILGAQEDGLRGGTYNTIAIKCFGAAIASLDPSEESIVRSRRNYLLNLLTKIDGVHLNGNLNDRIYNNINIRIDNLSINNQQIVSLLEMDGFIVSAGSACHAGDPAPSHVLKAIGLSDSQANSSIRITLGIENTIQELEDFAKSLELIVKMNQKTGVD